LELTAVFDIFGLITEGTSDILTRQKTIAIRKVAFDITTRPMIKMAFDTRRINQETDYIPRRGLQNFHRSEQFVSEGTALKVKAFAKLEGVMNDLKNEFGREPEWQDSYSRVLCSTLNKTLQTSHADGDFSDSQPSMTSLDYLEELMYVRYRLTPDNLLSMASDDLRSTILKKDELLIRGAPRPIISPSDVANSTYERMMDKMLATMAQMISNSKNDSLADRLFDVKATSGDPNIERTVVIKIKDQLSKEVVKRGA
jgi:hypothetical protein